MSDLKDGFTDADYAHMPASWIRFQKGLIELVDDCSKANENFSPEHIAEMLKEAPNAQPPNRHQFMAGFLGGLCLSLYRRGGLSDEAILRHLLYVMSLCPRIAPAPGPDDPDPLDRHRKAIADRLADETPKERDPG